MGHAGPEPGAMECLNFLYGIFFLTNALLVYTKYITCISVISHSDSCACTYNKGCISNHDWIRKYPCHLTRDLRAYSCYFNLLFILNIYLKFLARVSWVDRPNKAGGGYSDIFKHM